MKGFNNNASLRMFRRRTVPALAALGILSLFLCYGCGGGSSGGQNGIQHAGAAGRVVVNGLELTPAQQQQIASQFHLQIPAGDYWYDALTGAWGLTGGPALGLVQPGLPINAPLPANASHGDTGVFINGRQLPRADVDRLTKWLGIAVQPGRWWVHADGTFGQEGDSTPVGNLIQIARQNHPSGDGSFASSNTGVMGFVSGGAWSVSVKNSDGSFTSVGDSGSSWSD